MINELAPGTAAGASSNHGGGNLSMAGANIGMIGSAAPASNGRIGGLNNPSFA